MFFSWYIKNKQFKAGSGLSGQIAPFLIIILAVLLIAAIATVNIGRVSIDKTCSANAADAGSLAAASAWAGALNSLAVTNEELFQKSYDVTYNAMSVLAEAADGYIDEAIILSAVAAPLAVAAQLVMAPGVVEDTVWVGGSIGGVLDISAGWMLLEASVDVNSFNMIVATMQSLTIGFNEQQRKNYCETRDSMQQAWNNANEVGYSYAFSNSCIQDKLSNKMTLSEPISQMDAYNVWVSGGGPYKEPALAPFSEPHKYIWQDSYLPSQRHIVSVSLDLPNISSYQLEHTVGSYSHIRDVLDGLIERSGIIAGVLNSVSVMVTATGFLAILGFTISVIYAATVFCHVIVYCLALHEAFGVWAKSLSLLACSKMLLVVATLAGIVALAGAFSVYLLRDDLNDVYADWGPDVKNIFTSTTCDDVADLLIVKIDHVTLVPPNPYRSNGWSAYLSTTQNHGAGTNAGILSTTYTSVTSSCTAKFDGCVPCGDIGGFQDTYDSTIINTS